MIEYTVTIPYRNDFEVEMWLIENIANYDGIHNTIEFGKSTHTYIFSEIEDAVAFKLVWANEK